MIMATLMDFVCRVIIIPSPDFSICIQVKIVRIYSKLVESIKGFYGSNTQGMKFAINKLWICNALHGIFAGSMRRNRGG